jgi:hypothetical protein
LRDVAGLRGTREVLLTRKRHEILQLSDIHGSVSAIVSAAKGVMSGPGHLHSPALSVVTTIRKTVIAIPDFQRLRHRCTRLTLYYSRKISPIGNLQHSNRRLQSWHINCDSVDLAKG